MADQICKAHAGPGEAQAGCDVGRNGCLVKRGLTKQTFYENVESARSL
jgi:hypothetical protein